MSANRHPQKLLVTGGAGFIGATLIRHIIGSSTYHVCNVDKLTYAGTPEALAEVERDARYHFVHADICDDAAIADVFEMFRPDAVMHLAAETHVDRSIDGPGSFLETNIMGTYTLLETARTYYASLDSRAQKRFRFHHISTDEVFGSLGPTGRFTEQSRYQPNSPYAASKASSDHLVRAWHHTYGLPVLISHCCNNYGPYQFPEKLIPALMRNAVAGAALPIYGNGQNVRDWIFVEDHAEALLLCLQAGGIGQTYGIGGQAERTNLDVARAVCALLDEMLPDETRSPYENLIEFVPDRPGHDHRYAIDFTKFERETGWRPRHGFEQGLRKTVGWYLANPDWMDRAASRTDVTESPRPGVATGVRARGRERMATAGWRA